MKLKFLFSISLISSLQAIDSHLELLPIDMQKYLCLFFIEKDPEKTNDQNCLQSIQNLRSFLSTCKKFYKFLDDVHFASYFINNLDHDQEDINLSKILHATRLNTQALNKYVENILDNNPNTKARLINLLVINCLNNDHPKKDLGILVKIISPDADNSNFTPLTAAASWANVEKMDLLLKSGADINKKNPRGKTALHEADHLEVIEFLIGRGADLNIQDNEGNTPLIHACNLAHQTKIELLLKNNANRAIKNHAGKTAQERVEAWLHRSKEIAERNPDSFFECEYDVDYFNKIIDFFKKYPEQQ